MTPGDRVRVFCTDTATRDLDTLLRHFSPDASYHNVGTRASVGHAAIRSALAAQFDSFPGRYQYRLVHCFEAGDTVLTERVDILTAADGGEHHLPVMGVFQVRGGLIVSWRDYWDSRLLTRMLRGEECSDLVPSVCDLDSPSAEYGQALM
ncbi:nuclear transport factor 2 family protein [Mycolicibacterium tokaiense]|uniref:Limonene-1,2-epoxide hydrolase n=1 Tax=Mycolicibacterium tokaiense TaxID=39695 RepID=A0A378TAQ9_9MYCO|nr:limonene-1,2-epoxide hydrolase family protein [Mycolicibacterium tokaiense]BBY88534.1 hypothetical protein MTOK_43160 [Mycolicibacterium tokaiense]STZ56943.1 limonene-1,2-epoxide hydrolase [Mycolicibacterium tokaiense]